jgi:hypothetical protein
MAGSRKIWEKGMILAPRDRLRIQGEGIGTLAGCLALHSALRVPIFRLSIFGLTTWTCFGNEAADDLFQTSIDPAPRMRANF